MKFKLIFVLFNGIVLLSFLFVFLIPVFFLGWEYSRTFWATNWPLAALFLVIIGGLNTYFAVNWKMFGLLEAENWRGLIGHLEERIYTQRRFRKQHVQLLINGYILVSEPSRILKLEEHFREHRPDMIPLFALPFGVPHLLMNDHEDLERYYGELKNDPRCTDRPWIEWSYAFSLLLQRRADEARDVLMAVPSQTRNPLLKALSFYLLDAMVPHEQNVKNAVLEGKKALRARFSDAQWQKEIEKNRANLQVVVLQKLVNDASLWIFDAGNQAA
ncbi:MAG: hypothetical protein EA403_13425 [Spirochaetaceae bacterium]|nr:MAG: hypothetical protein EA403_13425 [Spirochaetaceae bacterium]